jgi:hypothetical protein
MILSYFMYNSSIKLRDPEPLFCIFLVEARLFTVVRAEKMRAPSSLWYD